MIYGTESVYPVSDDESFGLNIRQLFAATILSGLVSKYTMNVPEDQDTVCQMAVELANNLIKHLNND